MKYQRSRASDAPSLPFMENSGVKSDCPNTRFLPKPSPHSAPTSTRAKTNGMPVAGAIIGAESTALSNRAG